MPKFDGVVTTTRSQGLAIRAENYAPDLIAMPIEGVDDLACDYIPELDALRW